MILGPENLTLIHETEVTEQQPGLGTSLGAEPLSEFIHGSIRDQPGKEGSGPAGTPGLQGGTGGQTPLLSLPGGLMPSRAPVRAPRPQTGLLC